MDEVGRGPLAGPVAAAIVILDLRALPKGVDDSKKLSAQRREALFESVIENAVAVSFGFASAREIDAINIRQATHLAMRRAAHGLHIRPHTVLIDGNDAPSGLPCACRTLVKGDALSLSIAAASIVAKVMRDRMMARLAAQYPHYGFERHAGYATEDHLSAIDRHGPCPHHRLSFSPFKQAAR
ncbi:MAG: ribonuclease HII [Hyphomicrobiales bacterium]|nr:ribonuclease HII [Hyphomicrobiales bacterium]